MVVETSLPREISAQSVFDVTFAPRALEIFLALRRITFAETTFPVYELKWHPVLG
jgi:hypothetical protein